MPKEEILDLEEKSCFYQKKGKFSVRLECKRRGEDWHLRSQDENILHNYNGAARQFHTTLPQQSAPSAGTDMLSSGESPFRLSCRTSHVANSVVCGLLSY